MVSGLRGLSPSFGRGPGETRDEAGGKRGGVRRARRVDSVSNDVWAHPTRRAGRQSLPALQYFPS